MSSLLCSDALDGLSRQSFSPADLRDAQRNSTRVLLDRARFLPDADRRLVQLALKHRLSVRELADFEAEIRVHRYRRRGFELRRGHRAGLLLPDLSKGPSSLDHRTPGAPA